MKNERIFTLDELTLATLVVMWALIFVHVEKIEIISDTGLALSGMTGALLCTCMARIRLRTSHRGVYEHLNGASVIAPWNRPENRQMRGYMWRLRFRERHDTSLSMLLWGGILFSITGFLGVGLMFVRAFARNR